jgi:hypothetical protein
VGKILGMAGGHPGGGMNSKLFQIQGILARKTRWAGLAIAATSQNFCNKLWQK